MEVSQCGVLNNSFLKHQIMSTFCISNPPVVSANFHSKSL